MENNQEVGQLYLHLLKKVLTGTIREKNFEEIPPNTKTFARALRTFVYKMIQKILSPFKLALVHYRRQAGDSMIGEGAMDNLHTCLREVLEQRVPGDICEAGIWRGGSCIFIRAALKVYEDRTRKVWAADSFEGCPKPDSEKYPADDGSRLWELSLGVTLEEVKKNFEKYGLLDDQVQFIKGYFSDTMPTAPIEKLALLRLDGDMYESTMVVLKYLYPKLSAGGYVIIDDYGMIEACTQAVIDFRRENNIEETLQIIDYVKGKPLGAFWKKENFLRMGDARTCF